MVPEWFQNKDPLSEKDFKLQRLNIFYMSLMSEKGRQT